jgi:tetratricopeptide (TPR) repeat protein
LGTKNEEATALNNIALIYDKKGELDKALDYYEQSLRLKSEKEKAPTYNNIALIYNQKGDHKKAIGYLTKAIEISERVGDYHETAMMILNLGETYRGAKDFSKAEENLNSVQKARRIMRFLV